MTLSSIEINKITIGFMKEHKSGLSELLLAHPQNSPSLIILLCSVGNRAIHRELEHINIIDSH